VGFFSRFFLFFFFLRTGSTAPPFQGFIRKIFAFFLFFPPLPHPPSSDRLEIRKLSLLHFVPLAQILLFSSGGRKNSSPQMEAD